MLKKYKKLIFFLFIFIIGLAILINSVALGYKSMSYIMNLNRNGIDTNIYLVYLEQSIIKYRYTGAILSLLGGLALILENEKSY